MTHAIDRDGKPVGRYNVMALCGREVHTRLTATRPSCMQCERQLVIGSFNKRVAARLQSAGSRLYEGQAGR